MQPSLIFGALVAVGYCTYISGKRLGFVLGFRAGRDSRRQPVPLPGNVSNHRPRRFPDDWMPGPATKEDNQR